MALNPDNQETSGALDQEVAKLREEIRLETKLLYIGFFGVVVALSVYALEALHERNQSYNELLRKVDLIESQIYINGQTYKTQE